MHPNTADKIDFIYQYITIKVGRKFKGSYQKGFAMRRPEEDYPFDSDLMRLREAERIRCATRCKETAIPYIDGLLKLHLAPAHA
jgi:hypothetical protein